MKTLITNTKTLNSLAKANKIKFPIDVNNSKKLPFKYVDEVEGIGMNFKYNGKKYQLVFHSGCFFPYVYLVS